MLSSHCLEVSTVGHELSSVQVHIPLREFETYHGVSRQLFGLIAPVMQEVSLYKINLIKVNFLVITHQLCLSVFLLTNSHENCCSDLHENFIRDVSVDKEELVNFGTHPPLDLDPAMFLRILQHCKNFHNLAHISGNLIGSL